jgi:predicted GNAT family acetyltransferase
MVDARLFEGRGTAYLWENEAGTPVAMASASGPTPHGIRIGGVYTPPELRGRGYASSAVAALSARLLDEGRRLCFLFTDASNPTSNSIYRRIGYEQVAEVVELRFGPD